MTVPYDYLDCLSSLEHLQELRLFECLWTTKHLATPQSQAVSIFKWAPHLTALELPDFQQLARIPKLTSLRKLALAHADCPPDDVLTQLSNLTSMHCAKFSERLTMFTGLQMLKTSNRIAFELFPGCFSVLSNVTSLEAGSLLGTKQRDILSMKVFPNLRRLVLNGPVNCTEYDYHPKQSRRWEALMTFTSLQHLELVCVHHTSELFKQLSTMTQLTHLRFWSINMQWEFPQLCQLLLHWTALTNLSTLQCVLIALDLTRTMSGILLFAMKISRQ